MTYKQAFDRITEAYIKDELDPFDGCACFIGNLLRCGDDWMFCRSEVTGSSRRNDIAEMVIAAFGDGVYEPSDIIEMERIFLQTISDNTLKTTTIYGDGALMKREHDNYENALFLAMESTLEMLKQIHIRSGEIVDAPVFTKRQLQTV